MWEMKYGISAHVYTSGIKEALKLTWAGKLAVSGTGRIMNPELEGQYLMRLQKS